MGDAVQDANHNRSNDWGGFGHIGSCWSTSSAMFEDGTGTWTSTTSPDTNNNYLACSATSRGVPGYTWWDVGDVKTQQPAPFSVQGSAGSFDAINLGGGVGADFSMGNEYTATAWSVCLWFSVADSNGALVFSTGLNADGSPYSGALVLGVGTVGNLVMYENVPGSGTAVSLNYTPNGSWAWACVSYNSATLTATLTGYNSTKKYAITLPQAISYSNDSSLTGSDHYAWAEGNVSLYGMEAAPCDAGCMDGAWKTPSNPSTSGGGTVGSPSGPGTCTQTGPVSGASKFQWCPPQLGCQNIDTGWNIGNDFAWLGCIIEQAGLSIVGAIANVFIDLILPGDGWTGPISTVYSDLQTREPFNYVTGALAAVPTIINGPAVTPDYTVHFDVPSIGHFQAVSLDFGQALQFLAPYRAFMAAAVYVALGFAIIRKGQHLLNA
jgi:hypothetical protein